MLMDQLPLEPRARHSDPSTAHEAAAVVKAGSVAMNAAIVAAVKCDAFGGPVTAFDIAEIVERHEPGRWEAGSVRTAVSRLARAKRIRKLDENGKSPRRRRCARYVA